MIKLKLEISAKNAEELALALSNISGEIAGGGHIGNFYNDENAQLINYSYFDEDEKRTEFEEEAGYKLSDNQLQFCLDAEKAENEIDFNYSGRGMFGIVCPAVRVDRTSEAKTTANYKVDSMGLGVVVYAEL